MKQLISCVGIIGLILIGCESISDPKPVSDALSPTGETSSVGTLSGGTTKEMCKEDPGWEELGFRNLGQCIRYVKTNRDSRPGVTDIDGNFYLTVTIGDQLWMAENLKVTRYRNGDLIYNVTRDDMWMKIIDNTGAWIIYNNDLANDDTYGKLYNWYAVDDERGLCPDGWGVPTDDDQKQLEMYLGLSQQEADDIEWRGTDEGGKMKSTRTAPDDAHPRWDSPNTGATNESGFSGLPGGYRDFSSEDIGSFGYWWSSTEFDIDDAWYRSLGYNSSNVYRYYADNRSGFSIRCVMD